MFLFIVFRESLFNLYSQEKNATAIFNFYSSIRAICFPIIGINAFLSYILSEKYRKRILSGNIIALAFEIVLVAVVVFKTNFNMQIIAIIEIFARTIKLIIFIYPFRKDFKIIVLDEFKFENIKKLININKKVIIISFITFMNVFVGMLILKLYSYVDASKILCITISDDILNITSNLFVALSNITTTQISPEMNNKGLMLKRKIKNVYKYINKMYLLFFIITILFSIIFLQLYNINTETLRSTMTILFIRCILYIAIPLTDFHILLLKTKMDVKKLWIVDTVYDFIILFLSFFIYKVLLIDLIGVVFIYSLLLFIQTIASRKFVKEMYQ